MKTKNTIYIASGPMTHRAGVAKIKMLAIKGSSRLASNPKGLTASTRDFFWQTAFRLGLPVARFWWRLSRPRHESAVVIIYVGLALLLVRQSYRDGWHLPGGGIR